MRMIGWIHQNIVKINWGRGPQDGRAGPLGHHDSPQLDRDPAGVEGEVDPKEPLRDEERRASAG